MKSQSPHLNKMVLEQVFSRSANAKINLALHVTGQRNDGYHLLDTLVCFIDIADRLDVSLALDGFDQTNLTISGPFASSLESTDNNLVIKAASALSAKLASMEIDCPAVNIHLEKNLPVASGIGGGSADAAAILVLLCTLWASDMEIELADIAIALGADVPMCLNNMPKHASGIGEILSPLPLDCSLPIVLVNPGVSISTPLVFDALENKSQPLINMDEIQNLNSIENIVAILSPLNNDLEPAAINLVPKISNVLAAINSQNGCLLSRMSGSGATCFGVFETEECAARASAKINSLHADWWCASGNSIAAKEIIHD